MRTGAQLLCDCLEILGVEVVFGLPGTQNVSLFQGLRTSRLRTVVASHELGAGFMANGYARASGRVGIVLAIPGPGFTYAITALVEARHDSAPVVLITGTPAEAAGRQFPFQALDQAGMVRGVVKTALRCDRADQIAVVIDAALTAALSGEPGPVLVELAPDALTESARATPVVRSFAPDGTVAESVAQEIALRLTAARRPLLLAGQGAAGSSAALLSLVETLGCPVNTTLSGRGVVAEDHPLNLAADMGSEAIHVLNQAIDSADLVLAWGCKFSHNGTGGFRLALPADRLVHVDASAEVAGTNYPASLAAVADVPAVLQVLAGLGLQRSEWTHAEIARLRGEATSAARMGVVEPTIHGTDPPTAEAFFASLRRGLPRETILVTDSGLHQLLARRHWRVMAPRGFIAPSDFQSMGFGIPAGVGALLAQPNRPVVVVTGDGGFNMAGLELLTAVRDKIPLVVVVLNDGQYGLMRLQQLGDYGQAHGVRIAVPDYAAIAAAIGTEYRILEGDAGAVVGAALKERRPAILEVVVGDSVDMMRLRARSLVKETARKLLPSDVLRRLRGRP